MAHKHSCRKYEIMIEKYIDGTLSGRDLKKLEAHIAECPECREDLRITLALHRMVKRAAAEVPPELHERIMDAVSKEAKPVQKKPKTRLMRTAAVAAACFLICAVCTFGFSMLPLFNDASSGEAVPDGGIGTCEQPYSPECDSEGGDPLENMQATEIAASNSTASPSPEAVPGTTSSGAAKDESTAAADESPDDYSVSIEGETKFPFEETMADPVEIPSEATGSPVADTLPTASPTDAPFPAPAPDEDSFVLPESDGSRRPGGNEITLALLIVSGLLAVASFIAFLISLSSVRRLGRDKENK